MTAVANYPQTHQGVRDLNNPIRQSPTVNLGTTERVASELGGSLLAGFGLARGGIVGLTMAAVGGMLVYRGYTGHCSAYAAAGVRTN